jgi:hypothetical protein
MKEVFVFNCLYNYTFMYSSVCVSLMGQFKLRLNLDVNIDLLYGERRRSEIDVPVRQLLIRHC